MTKRSEGRVVLVGCGRWLRRDDQAGLLVAGAIERGGWGRRPDDAPADIAIYATESPGVDLVTLLDGVDLLVVVDAAEQGPGYPPGGWQRIDYRRSPDRVKHSGGSDAHTLGVGTALELAGQMDRLPADVWIYAISVATVDYGEAVSAEVQEAIQSLSRRIPSDIEIWCGQREGSGA
ncbi:MAG: hydrogenase maturation protease [Phycisphaerae bacterium]|nr:hydrogenase maturation protease [Phycisphaerae bacterium]